MERSTEDAGTGGRRASKGPSRSRPSRTERRADEIQMAQTEIDKELKNSIKMMELQAQQAQAQATTSSATTRNKHAKSLKLPSFIDGKDEADCYLLRFECYAENASWEKDTWAITLSVLLTGRAMDVYARMSDTDASDYDKFEEGTLNKVQLHR